MYYIKSGAARDDSRMTCMGAIVASALSWWQVRRNCSPAIAVMAKRARFTDVMCEHYVSRTAMSEILRAARDEGVPDAISRSTFFRDRKAVCGRVTPYGPLVQHHEIMRTSGPYKIGVCPPMPLLWEMSKEPAFARLLLLTHQRTPCSVAKPWRVVLYCDEVSPSNPLQTGPDHRKVQAVYWSILEFGMDVLCHEAVWFVLSTVRSEVVAELDGGMSHLVKMILERNFFDCDGHHLERGGLQLELEHGATRVRILVLMKMGCLVGDELALKDLLLCKGHAGLKPCCCCSKVVLARSELASSGLHVPSDSIDVARMEQHTNESIIAILHRLSAARGTMSKARFEELESMLGWNYSERNFLLPRCIEMMPASWIMYDWTRVYVVKGVFNNEVGRFIKHRARRFQSILIGVCPR